MNRTSGFFRTKNNPQHHYLNNSHSQYGFNNNDDFGYNQQMNRITNHDIGREINKRKYIDEVHVMMDSMKRNKQEMANN